MSRRRRQRRRDREILARLERHHDAMIALAKVSLSVAGGARPS